MFKVGDIVTRNDYHGNSPVYKRGKIVNVMFENGQMIAEVRWGLSPPFFDRLFLERWHTNSLKTFEDPCDLLKEVL